jgi:hypothetical protein
MGYIFAHLHAGEEVLKVGSYAAHNRRLYNFGAMGPDFIFMESARWEKVLHDERAVKLADFMLKNANEETKDFALGYATHIYADIEMYPVVMRAAENDFRKYVRIEMCFDILLAKRVYKIDINSISLASKIYAGKSLSSAVITLLSEGIKNIYKSEAVTLEPSDINRAYVKFLKYVRLLDILKSPFLFSTKRTFLKLSEKITRSDILTFVYPDSTNQCTNLYEEIFESLERGIEKSKTHLEKYLL